MRRFPLIVLSTILALNMTITVSAAVKNAQQYANRRTLFNNVTDFFATLGESERDKSRILQKRQTVRRNARLENLREQKKSEAIRRRRRSRR